MYRPDPGGRLACGCRYFRSNALPPHAIHLILHAVDAVMHLDYLLLELGDLDSGLLLHQRQMMCVVLQLLLQLHVFVAGLYVVHEIGMLLRCDMRVVSVRGTVVVGVPSRVLAQPCHNLFFGSHRTA